MKTGFWQTLSLLFGIAAMTITAGAQSGGPSPVQPIPPTNPAPTTQPPKPSPTAPANPAANPAPAQPTAPATTVAPVTSGIPVTIDTRVRPDYPFQPQRLKKRPPMTGVIAPGTWDSLYTVDTGPVKGTFYMDWDNNYLYLAAQSDQSAWVVFDIDATDNGWLRGNDNLEISVSPVTEDGGGALSVRVLDASSSKDTPVWNDTTINPKDINVVTKLVNGQQTVELAIPNGTAGLYLHNGSAIGLRGDFLPAAVEFKPTAPYEPHLLIDLTLTDTQVQTVPGLVPQLYLNDDLPIAGEHVNATLKILNQNDLPAAIQSVTWEGVGPANQIVKFERVVNVPSVQGGKTLNLHYNTVLPDSVIPGFYTFEGKVELADGSTMVVTNNFQVVEAFNLALISEPNPLLVIGPSKLKVLVQIHSEVPGHARGDVSLEAPAGWIIKGAHKKGFYIGRKGGTIKAPFYLTVPSQTPSGRYDLIGTVSWYGKKWQARMSLPATRAPEPVTPSASQAPATSPSAPAGSK